MNVFDHKPRIILSKSSPIRFNRMEVKIANDDAIFINISTHAASLEMKQSTNYDIHKYVTARAKGAYIVTVNIPDLTI